MPPAGGGQYLESQRVVGLDLFRIFLALLVFLFHSRIHVLKCDYGFLNGFVEMGAIAMTGFFLLSGYAISLSSVRKDMSDKGAIKNFYVKRLIAIIPLYYAYALLNVILNIIGRGGVAAVQELLLLPVETLGIQSVYSTLFPFSHNGGSWFISCILFCYLAYPLLSILTRDISDRMRVLLIFVLSAILLYSPFVQYFFDCQKIYSNPFFRLLEFSMGILVAQLNINTCTKNRLIVLLRTRVACIVTVITLITGVTVARDIGIPADYMLYNWIALPCFISLLISLGHLKFESLQNSKIVRYLSSLSFPFFLSQLLIVWSGVRFLLGRWGILNNMTSILFSLAVCFVLANVYHFCIEAPSAKYLKAKFL